MPPVHMHRNNAQDLVDEHVQESLAKHCMEELGNPRAALPHYMAVLRHPSSGLATQTQHMTKFLEAVLQSEEAAVCCGYTVPCVGACKITAKAKQHMATRPCCLHTPKRASQKHKLPLELPLPVMDPTRAVVRCGGQTSYAQPEARAVPEAVWTAMEAALQPAEAADAAPSGGPTRSTVASAPLSGTCVAGETVAVDLQLTNPLALPLECGFMRLLVDHWDGGQGGGQRGAGGGSSSDDVLTNPPDSLVEVRARHMHARFRYSINTRSWRSTSASPRGRRKPSRCTPPPRWRAC